MSIDHLGRIERTYNDTCVNYNPDKSKPTSVVSAISGTIFECFNVESPNNACYNCENRKEKGDKELRKYIV